jgi:hypothetical protein
LFIEALLTIAKQWNNLRVHQWEERKKIFSLKLEENVVICGDRSKCGRQYVKCIK